VQALGPLDARAVDDSAVGAAQILDPPLAVAELKYGVTC
jgi:hypothetical protein